MKARSAQLLAAAVVALTPFAAQAVGQSPARDFRLSNSFVTYGYSRSTRFSNASALFYDTRRGELYVADTGNNQIAVFDNKGNPVARFRHEVWDDAMEKRLPGEPRGVVVRPNGDILVTDNLCNYLDVLDYQGRSVQRLWPADLLKLSRSKVRPACLGLHPSGNILLSVTGEVNEILVLTPDLKLKAEIGRTTGPGALTEAVTGLWADKEGRIYATYVQGDCVRVYSPDGTMLTKFGVHDTGPNNFSLPSGATTDDVGNLWVVDTLRNSVSVFQRDVAGSELRYTFVRVALAGFATERATPGYPAAIAGDGLSRIFVLEKTGAKVHGYEVRFGQGSVAK